MQKIVILTPNPVDPLHFRTGCLARVLSEVYDVRLLHAAPGPKWLRWLDLLTATAFKLSNLQRYWPAAADADLLVVQEMSLLLHAAAARSRGQRVIYESIDNGPHLTSYWMAKRAPFVTRLTWLPPLLEIMEKSLVKACGLPVVVNSAALLEYFHGRASLIYYSSPFEDAGLRNNPDLAPAFVYLGQFIEEKGILDLPALCQRWSIPAFVFGSKTAENQHLHERFKAYGNIEVIPWLSATDLAGRLRDLMKRHFLMGVSLQRPVNLSYATQELNKDIDYLAVGAPIIGNRRGPTLDKIRAGCGVLADNDVGVGALMGSSPVRARLSRTCRDYYSERYAFSIYRNKILSLFESVIAGDDLARLPGGSPSFASSAIGPDVPSRGEVFRGRCRTQMPLRGRARRAASKARRAHASASSGSSKISSGAS